MRHCDAQGGLSGFLGTYTSRYTDYKGYWLFGFLSLILLLEVDLLGDSESRGPEPVEAARCLAIHAFADQLAKVAILESCVRRAGLVIRIVGEPVEEVGGGSHRRGNHHSRANVKRRLGKIPLKVAGGTALAS